MPLDGIEFLKLLGSQLAPILAARSVPPAAVTQNQPAAPRERLRQYWMRLQGLEQAEAKDFHVSIGKDAVSGHRFALSQLVASRELSAPAADLVQAAYEAAVDRLWLSQYPVMCYRVVEMNYDPASVEELDEQKRLLSHLVREEAIDPDTAQKAQAAVERDLTFHALTGAELKDLSERLGKEHTKPGQAVPSFEALRLRLTRETEEAMQFLLELLTEN
jgi:hypothetical protein